MKELRNEKSGEEIVESVAEALTEIGFSASSQDTGGGVLCVILKRKNGGEIVWGTADVNWGASVIDAFGDITSSIGTKCPSETQDIAAIVASIEGPSIDAGAVL